MGLTLHTHSPRLGAASPGRTWWGRDPGNAHRGPISFFMHFHLQRCFLKSISALMER